MPRITSNLRIPDEELSFSASRSSGPGGQHVNTTSSKVDLAFNVVDSPSLDDAQRARILDRLANRITKDGILRVSAQSSRSQTANKEEAVQRLVELLRQALRREKPRRPTRVPSAARRRRLESKKKRGHKKSLRKPPEPE